MNMTPSDIARATAEAIAIKYIEPPDKAQDWENVAVDIQGLILSAAAKIVRESGGGGGVRGFQGHAR